MATLLELTQQVDPGTVADEEKLGRDIQLMSRSSSTSCGSASTGRRRRST